jgi:hypothetical protein
MFGRRGEQPDRRIRLRIPYRMTCPDLLSFSLSRLYACRMSASGRFETLALASKYIIRTSGFGAKVAVKQC